MKRRDFIKSALVVATTAPLLTVDSSGIEIKEAAERLIVSDGIIFPTLSLTDPHILGMLWNNNSTLQISLG